MFIPLILLIQLFEHVQNYFNYCIYSSSIDCAFILVIIVNVNIFSYLFGHIKKKFNVKEFKPDFLINIGNERPDVLRGPY